MSLEIETFVLGPLENNTYLLFDSKSKDAVIVDPAIGSQVMLNVVRERNLKLRAVWLTHAHFDHIAGANFIAQSFQPALPVGLHVADLDLWRKDGGAVYLGFEFKAGPEPTFNFSHGQILKIGNHPIEVRHTPGHTPGHVVFYTSEDHTVLCGDLIFYRSVGRTDLTGGNMSTLIKSIRTQIFTLARNTRLLTGHGPETNVGEEMEENPFL